MTKKIVGFVLLALIVFAATNASAAPLTLNSPGVVGTLNGKTGANPPEDEALWAQHLLDMLKSSVDNIYTPGTGYRTSDTEYSDTLDYVGKDESQGNVVNGNYLYVFAKYDGQNGGYVLYYMPDWGSNTIPASPWSIWGNEGQYGVSHFLYFNEYEKDVPDGGSVAMLLGLGLIGLAGVRRMLK